MKTLPKLPRHIYPSDIGNEKLYFLLLEEFNKVLQTRMRSALESIIGEDGNHFAVLTTGSDGRFEKGPVSEMEFIIVEKPNDPEAEKQRSQVVGIISKFPNELADKKIEIKVLGRDSMSKYAELDLISPMRITDSVLLLGSENLHISALRQLVDEWLGTEGSSILKSVKEKRRNARKITESGEQSFKGDILTHFSLEDGIAIYDPLVNLRSFKEGPLRFVQYSLMSEIIKYARANKLVKALEILGSPKNTIRKLMYLWIKELSAFTQQEVSDLSNNYLHFLWLYHQSQEAYKRKNENIITFDKKEATQRSQDLVELLSRPFIKYS